MIMPLFFGSSLKNSKLGNGDAFQPALVHNILG
jgi:hypothetical protein